MKTINKAVSVFSRFTIKTACIITLSILLLSVVHILSLTLMASSGPVSLGRSFFLHVLSVNMVPFMGLYIALMGTLYFLFVKTKGRIAKSYSAAIEEARHDGAVTALQKMTGIMAEQLAAPNSELIQYIAVKKEKGQAPVAVESASAGISRALQGLSWISFVLPHVKTVKERDGLMEKYPDNLRNAFEGKKPLLIPDSGNSGIEPE